MNSDTIASDFFVAGGTLRPDSPSYVKRAADDDLFGLALAGKFCYALTARQMGKSSLMARTAKRLKEQGVRTAIIDLTQIGTVATEQWYLGLLTRLTAELRLSVNPQVWWEERSSLGAVQRFTNFVHEMVLQKVEGRIVVFVDEVDNTLRLDFADDFFAAIRSMYNARASDPAFNRLTFVLLGVATPSDLVKDLTRTPFNIGQGIDLHEFTRQDAQALQQGLKAIYPEQGGAIFDRIFYWTNGHPYLTQKLCGAVAEERSRNWNNEQVDALVEKLFLSEEARKEANLQFVRNSIAASPQRRGLLGLYRKVYEGKTVPDDERSLEQSRLKLFGLVRAEKGELKVRNEIYRRAFNLDWIKANTPVDWTRRIAVVSMMLVLLLASFIVYSLSRQKQQTSEAQAQLLIQNFSSTTSAEVRITSLAGLINIGYDDRARALFDGLAPSDQLALFNLTNPSSVGDQLIKVIRGMYTDLENDERGNQLLQAMAPPLRKVGDSESINLATEIDQWLQGRASYSRGDYRQAAKAYDVAISLNSRNPSTYFDRGLTYASLGESDKALTDLDAVLSLNSGKAWQDRVLQAIVRDGGLYSVWWQEKEKYKVLIGLLPTPTSTPAPAKASMPAPASTPVPTSTSVPPTRTPIPTPTRTPIPSPTRTSIPSPMATPTPPCPPVIGPFASIWSSVQGKVGCAEKSAQNIMLVMQKFPRGEMFWREDNLQIYVLYYGDGWGKYNDTWKESTPEPSCTVESQQTPIRGFGKVWCTVPAVRNGLGYATNEGERGFNGTVQDFQHGVMIRTDEGKSYVLYSGNGWENR